MKRKFRIEDNELLNQNHYPVKVLFDLNKIISCFDKASGLGRIPI